MPNAKNDILITAWYQRGKQGLVLAKGCSMQPLIKSGMKLLIQPCSYYEVRPGDIGLFHQNSGLIAHRIIFKEIYKDKVYIGHKGDNTRYIQTVPLDCLMGKVIQIKTTEGSLNLEELYWRIINRCLGWYSVVLWKITYITNKKKKKHFSNTLAKNCQLSKKERVFTLRISYFLSVPV